MLEGRIDPRFSAESTVAPPWREIERDLSAAQLYWIVTVRRDGRPHAVPLIGLWSDGAFCFCTGDDEQKQRNLESNAQVGVVAGTLGADGWASGRDIVVDGRAQRVTNSQQLQDLADAWVAKYGDEWRYEVRDQAFFHARDWEAGGSSPVLVYRVVPDKVMAFLGGSGQATYRASE